LLSLDHEDIGLKQIIQLACLSWVAGACLAQDVATEARHLAIAGERKAALEMLSKRLEATPSDLDARIVYGTVLAWEGDYPRARAELSRALADSPKNGDAMQALANVELWTDHPAEAEDLLLPLVKARAGDTDILYAHAKALKGLNRREEALSVLNRLLELDPSNHDAFNLRAGLSETVPLWEASVREYYESFSDGIGNRKETQVALKRSTSLGSVIGRYSGASRFGDIGNQLEVDFYPGIRKGTYLYLNVGFSPEGTLYPHYRAAGEVFQSLGKGFEAAAGYRRLGFTSPVNVYTTALSKYYGNWLFSGRGYFTPGDGGTSKSFQVSTRRFFSDSRSYLEFTYGRGSSPYGIRSSIDLQVFDANSGSVGLDKALGHSWLVSGNFGIGHEERPNRPAVYHRTSTLSLSFRF
jgi:YaiO family outer membrane protein